MIWHGSLCTFFQNYKPQGLDLGQKLSLLGSTKSCLLPTRLLLTHVDNINDFSTHQHVTLLIDRTNFLCKCLSYSTQQGGLICTQKDCRRQCGLVKFLRKFDTYFFISLFYRFKTESRCHLCVVFHMLLWRCDRIDQQRSIIATWSEWPSVLAISISSCKHYWREKTHLCFYQILSCFCFIFWKQEQEVATSTKDKV